MNFSIDEIKLRGFNDNAKEHLRSATVSFVDDIISESLRIESDKNSTRVGAEVTSSIVDLANKSLRNGLIRKKLTKMDIALKIFSNLCWGIAGAMFFSEKIKEQWFIILFVFVLAGAFLCTTFDILRKE